MRKLTVLFVIVIPLMACTRNASQTDEQFPVDGPIQLHPHNPHYFLYNDKTIALISSAEHYGAVLNLDFDYHTYLESMAEDGMNYTRIFSGTYFEIEGRSFGIKNNTLGKANGRIITPWTEVIQDLSGEVKYDLSAWNDTYFKRLRDFMQVAADHDIIVEVTLFSSIYNDNHWDINPQNPANNINLTEELTRFDAHTRNNGSLLIHQVNFVRKIVQELNEFNNFFFEIQNEPWSDHPVAVYNIVNKEDLKTGDWSYKADFADEISMAWQKNLAEIIVEEESKLPKKHLIAQNYTNFKAPVPEVSEHVSIINFHYAWPEAVRWNYHYNKVIGFDESGFAGPGDQVYRRQAWQFMLSGGGLFNNLDYSFFVGYEDGSGENQAPGGGSETLRQQLKSLSDFLHSFDLETLNPFPTCIHSSPGLIPYILSDKFATYAIYLRAVGTENSTLELATGDGTFRIQELNTLTGSYSDPDRIKAEEGILSIDIIIPDGELALKITRE